MTTEGNKLYGRSRANNEINVLEWKEVVGGGGGWGGGGNVRIVVIAWLHVHCQIKKNLDAAERNTFTISKQLLRICKCNSNLDSFQKKKFFFSFFCNLKKKNFKKNLDVAYEYEKKNYSLENYFILIKIKYVF